MKSDAMNNLESDNCAVEDLKEVLSEFECPVCFEVMVPPKRIYSCSNDHYICQHTNHK